MPRPRLPAQVLALRGSFEAHPERKRADAPGAGPWQDAPPEHLSAAELTAWAELVSMLPKVALTSSDTVAVTQAARLWSALKVTPPTEPQFKHLDDALRRWCIELGLTPHARTRLAPAPAEKAPNPFLAIRERYGV